MNLSDLQKFCGAEKSRYYLTRPFSSGEFSYATNGHIMVRIPRDPEIAESDYASSKPIDWNGPLQPHDGATFAPLDLVLPPLATDAEDCGRCHEGHEHDCPSCDCVCVHCHGTGKEIPEQHTSADVNGAPFTLRYIRMAMSLAGVQFGVSKDNGPMPFVFDGGIGVIMPRNGRSHDHIELKTKASDHQS